MSIVKSVQEGKITVTHAADKEGKTETTFTISKEREEYLKKVVVHALHKARSTNYETMYILKRLAQQEWSVLLGVW